MNKQQQNYINTHSKSRLISFVLTVLVGPLGLLYSSPVMGFILLIIAIIGVSTVIVPVVCWVLSVLIGDSATYSYNQKIKSAVELSGLNAM